MLLSRAPEYVQGPEVHSEINCCRYAPPEAEPTASRREGVRQLLSCRRRSAVADVAGPPAQGHRFGNLERPGQSMPGAVSWHRSNTLRSRCGTSAQDDYGNGTSSSHGIKAAMADVHPAIGK
jgi:hypothetical protein